jgi:hypothetical protein
MKSVKIVKLRGLYLIHDQIDKSFGHEGLDSVGKESFINHIHIMGPDRLGKSLKIINWWVAQLMRNWPKVSFRIYQIVSRGEVTLRLHSVRNGVPNWSEDKNGLIVINGIA